MEFLFNVLMERGISIKAIKFTLLKEYSTKLNKEYIDIFDYISSKALDGNIFELEKYIKNKVNGTFTKLIDSFTNDYKNS